MDQNLGQFSSTSNARREHAAVTKELRLKLLANGYVPLANSDKRCFLSGWPTLNVDEAMVERWCRVHGAPATGLRIDPPLAAIDLDIDDREAMAAIAERCKAFPGIFLLTRHGNGRKLALFVRSREAFDRVASRRFLRPGGNLDRAEDVAFVECFGGKGARQFGAFGPHSFHDDGSVAVTYRWPGNSPADMPLDKLPMLAKSDFLKIGDATEEVLLKLGWTPIERSQSGEDLSTRVYDLTDDMLFRCNDGCTRTLAELRAAASPWGDFRCTASFHNSSSNNDTRCRIGRDHQDGVSIHDHATGVTHHEARLEPLPFDAEALARRLRAMREAYNGR